MKRQAMFWGVMALIFGFILSDGIFLNHAGFCQPEEEEEEETLQTRPRPDTRPNPLLEGAGSGNKFWNVDNNPDSPLISNQGSAQGGESAAGISERMKPLAPAQQTMRPTKAMQQMRPTKPMQTMRPTAPRQTMRPTKAMQQMRPTKPMQTMRPTAPQQTMRPTKAMQQMRPTSPIK